MNWLPTALCVVLILKAVLDNLKLKLTYGSYDLTTVKLIDKQLGNTLVHKLLKTFLKLL